MRANRPDLAQALQCRTVKHKLRLAQGIGTHLYLARRNTVPKSRTQCLDGSLFRRETGGQKGCGLPGQALQLGRGQYLFRELPAETPERPGDALQFHNIHSESDDHMPAPDGIPHADGPCSLAAGPPGFPRLKTDNGKNTMLSEKFLNEFEEYLKSGRLEEDYACSAEDRKVEILEYLERFMDLAEEADRVATRLLMPGLSAVPPDK